MFLDFGGIMKRGTGANPSDNESVDERRNIKGYGTIFSPFSHGGWLGGRVETERKD